MSTTAVLVVNPNTNEGTTRTLTDLAQQRLGSRFTAYGVTAMLGPRMITTAEALTSAIAPTIAAACAGVDRYAPAAVIIAAFGDPGLRELRARLSVPVIGIGESSVRAASANGRRFAIATTTPGLAEPLYALVADAAPAGRFDGLYLTATQGEVLANDHDRQTAELAEAVARAAAHGAEVVIIGGGPLSRSAQEIATASPVTVLEPLSAAVTSVLDRIGVPV